MVILDSYVSLPEGSFNTSLHLLKLYKWVVSFSFNIDIVSVYSVREYSPVFFREYNRSTSRKISEVP